MLFFDILGWVAAAFGMSAAVPQLVHLWRSRTSAGLSSRLWQLNAAGTMAWAMHGFLAEKVQLQIPNIICSAVYIGVLWFIVRDRGQRLLPKLVMPVLLALALFGIDLWLGPVVFGIVVASPLVVGQVAQLQFMRRSAELSGVSVPTLLVNVLVQLLWFIWGVGVGEAAITVCSALMGVLCVVNLVYYGWRRATGTAGASPADETEPVASETVA